MRVGGAAAEDLHKARRKISCHLPSSHNQSRLAGFDRSNESCKKDICPRHGTYWAVVARAEAARVGTEALRMPMRAC